MSGRLGPRLKGTPGKTPLSIEPEMPDFLASHVHDLSGRSWHCWIQPPLFNCERMEVIASFPEPFLTPEDGRRNHTIDAVSPGKRDLAQRVAPVIEAGRGPESKTTRSRTASEPILVSCNPSTSTSKTPPRVIEKTHENYDL